MQRRGISKRSKLVRRTPYTPRPRSVPFAVKAAMKPELKRFDQMHNTVGAFLLPIILPQIGGLNHDRLGNKVRVCRIVLRGTCSHKPIAIGTPESIRVVIVQDKMTSKVNPVLGDVFLSSASGPSTPQELLPRNQDQTGRFNILRDLVLDLSYWSDNAQNIVQKLITMDVKNLNIPIQFQDIDPATPPTVADATGQMLYIMTLGVLDAETVCNLHTSVYYYDT